MTARCLLVSGAVSGFLSVALGAFAAHALKDRLDAYRLDVFRLGAQYQIIHALALILVGILLTSAPDRRLGFAGGCFLVGSVVFSGSLYALGLTGVRAWGAVTPVGGVAFLLGWATLALAVYRR